MTFAWWSLFPLSTALCGNGAQKTTSAGHYPASKSHKRRNPSVPRRRRLLDITHYQKATNGEVHRCGEVHRRASPELRGNMSFCEAAVRLLPAGEKRPRQRDRTEEPALPVQLVLLFPTACAATNRSESRPRAWGAPSRPPPRSTPAPIAAGACARAVGCPARAPRLRRRSTEEGTINCTLSIFLPKR